MLSAYTKVPRNTQRSITRTIAAPVRGWNALDSLGDMDPLDAVTLTNFWPGTNSVLLRKGFTAHATSIPAQVESLMAYNAAVTSASILFAAAGTKIWDVTAGGAVTSTSATLTSISNARLQHVNFTTTGGSYLLWVNGADKMHAWDGTGWHADGSGAPYDVSILDTTTAINITTYKERIWLIVKDSLKAYYLPVGAIGGTAAFIDMGSVAQMGGYLMAAMTWTIDAGDGMDDYLVFITSKGEVLVWFINDPTDATKIALQGIYRIGAPIGRRCWIKYAGDLLVITEDGVVPMSGAIQSSRLNARVSITNQIQYAMSQAITNYGANFGWQLLQVPRHNQLYLNVPVATGSMQQQFVQNNITKAWCNFEGWHANCWELWQDEPYFGGNGFVGHAWNGASDNGGNIQGTALQAFNIYGTALQKQCKMIRPHFLSNGVINVFGDVNVDYDITDHSAQLSSSLLTFGVWDSGVWDAALWASDFIPLADWQGVTSIGYSLAPFIRTASLGSSLQWVATDLLFEVGGVL